MMACGNTKKASILLVRKLYTLMQNLGPLPDSVCLNMKLSYYDNGKQHPSSVYLLYRVYLLFCGLAFVCVCAISVTPEDYQPPGFKEGDSDSIEFEKEPVRLTMGEVATPFHTRKMDVTTERGRLEQVRLDVGAI